MKITALFLAFILPSVALADWSVIKKTDAMTDEVRKIAVIKNDIGHSFSLYRLNPGGPVWGNFRLSEKIIDQVNWRKAPMLRVDKNEPNDISLIKKIHDMGLHSYEWEPKWVNFRIWHGNEDDGIADSLIELMEGDSVIFRYYLSTGGYKDTSFTLSGASQAISEAISIDKSINKEKQRKIKESANLYSESIDICKENMDSFIPCYSKVSNCLKSNEGNDKGFKDCLEKNNLTK